MGPLVYHLELRAQNFFSDFSITTIGVSSPLLLLPNNYTVKQFDIDSSN
jgi:hypothetical protein